MSDVYFIFSIVLFSKGAENVLFSFDKVFYKTSYAGHLDCVQAVFPYINSHIANHGLICAASGGAVDVLRFLAPHADSHFLNSRALFAACVKEHHDCVDFLAPLSNIDECIAQLEQRAKRVELNGDQQMSHLRSIKEKFVLNTVLQVGGTKNSTTEPAKRKM